jgi:hypothetical protein
MMGAYFKVRGAKTPAEAPSSFLFLAKQVSKNRIGS